MGSEELETILGDRQKVRDQKYGVSREPAFADTSEGK